MLALLVTTMIATVPGSVGTNPCASAAERGTGAALFIAFEPHDHNNPPARSKPWAFPNRKSNSVENPNDPDR